ncbi:MAG: hypothetical protein DRI84_09875 [Bacteroidetes bacterium]|nr:MAG: hypothetical protein DRI84_09875 [Bacteroidota bacterium]
MTQSETVSKKTEKKKLIRVHNRAKKGTTYKESYKYSSINFAFVSSPENGRKQATCLMTCREYVNRAALGAATGTGDPNHDVNSDAPIDFDRLRLLIVHDPEGWEEFRTKLFNGKACLNLLEKVNKWKPSTITTVKHDTYDHAWLLTGPKEWMSQPQMLSLATWILRLAATSGPIETANFDAFEDDLENRINMQSGSDVGLYLESFWDKLYILTKYHDQIWEGVDKDKAWINVDPDSFGIYSGLLNFVSKTPTYSNCVQITQKRFFALCKEHLPRKKK